MTAAEEHLAETIKRAEEQLKVAKENLEETGKQAKEAEAELQAVKMAARGHQRGTASLDRRWIAAT